MYIHISKINTMNLKKQLFSLVALLAFVSFSFTASNPVTTYNVDPQSSTLTWVGKKVTGEHTGNIDITSGSLKYDGKKITGGEFVIDMQSITNSDLTDPEYNKKLVDHLKSDDFFGSEQNPTSKFVIKQVTARDDSKYDVTGDLTIKGKTNSVTFPATITDKGNQLVVEGNAVVDRAKYDVKYNSGSFFENLGDKMIYDDFELKINLVADKTQASK